MYLDSSVVWCRVEVVNELQWLAGKLFLNFILPGPLLISY